MTRLSVIAPCKDEELNLRELARRVLVTFDAGGLDGELVLVDDGSTDGTWSGIEALVAEHPMRIVGRRHARNAGIAASWRTGVAAARGELVAIMDADLQYAPEDLLRLLRERESHGVDVVQGFRSPVGRERGGRYWLSRGLNALLNATFGMRLRDNKSGFLVCRREVLADLLTFRQPYAYWQTFIMVAAHAKGYSYREVETLFESRRAGTSFLDGSTARAVVRSFGDIALAASEYGTFLARPRPRAHPSVPERRPPTEPVPHKRPVKGLRWDAYMATFDRTHWLITRDVERYYESLLESQWLSRSQLRDLQDAKLRDLVRHAYDTTPFHRERMQRAGLRPEDIRSTADLHKLPFLTKDDVRSRLYLGLLSDTHDKSQVLRIATSGSTGEPLVCFVDRAQLERRWAATLRSQEWTGYRFGDPCVRLWHQTVGLSKSQARKERLDALFSRRRFVPIFELTHDRIAETIADLEAWRPVLMDGYAEAFDLLAKYVARHGRIAARPRAIMTSAQTLPHASRRIIEDAFGCRVFDKYGAREFSGIAYECEAHRHHHVVAESYVVEILRDGVPAKPGETGEVVITDLDNRCQPFLRYRIGDLAVATDPDERCGCGRELPRIGAIEGRVQSIVVGAHGRYVPGTFFAHLFKEYDHAIRRFQVVQLTPGAIVLRLVKAGRYSNAVLEEILALSREALGHDMRIDVEFTPQIDLGPTGKRNVCVSRLDVDFQAGAPRRIHP